MPEQSPAPVKPAAKSPFAHRATNAPFPSQPSLAGATAAISPAPKPKSPSMSPYYAAGALLLGGGAVWAFYPSRAAVSPASAVPVVKKEESPESVLRRAESDSTAMRELAGRTGAEKAEPEVFARAMARLSEAAAHMKAGRVREAAEAHAGASARFGEAVTRVRRGEFNRALAAVSLKDVREYRSDLWRSLDEKVAAATEAERAGRFESAARLFDEAAVSVSACLGASRDEIARLAVEMESSGNMGAARLLHFKFAKLTPDDAANISWLMRHGRAAGDTVRDPLGIPFVYAPPGAYAQGSPESEAGRKSDETRRQVSLSRGYFFAATEITQAQWDAVMGAGDAAVRLSREPAAFRGADLPVVNVTWAEAADFCRKLSAKTGLRYRLPTEAEWEYACRAGQDGPYASGKLFLGVSDAVLDDATTGAPTSPKAVASVGAANAWGLRDMHGNVWEWCSDWYGARVAAAAADPAGPSDAESARSDSPMKIARGGSWNDPAHAARSANRWGYPPSVRVNYIGLRPVLEFSATIE